MNRCKMISSRRCGVLISAAALSIGVAADWANAQLATTGTFKGTGFSLITSGNYTPSTPPTASVLADVVGTEVPSSTGYVTVLGTGTTTLSMTLGAIAFDLRSTRTFLALRRLAEV